MKMKNSAIMVFLAIAYVLFTLHPVMSALTSSTTISSIGSIAVAQIEPLHIEGNQILTENGTVVKLRGVNYTYFIDSPYGSWMLPDSQIAWLTWDTDAIAQNLDAIKSWGCNCIRVIGTIELWVENTGNYRSNLKYFFVQAAARGIYVDFCFYLNNATGSFPYGMFPWEDVGNGYINTPQDLVDVWSSVASELKDYQNVLFEFWNEPIGDVAIWMDFSQQCINAVRSTGAENLIIIQYSDAVGVDFYDYPKVPSNTVSMSWVYEYQLSDPLGNLVYSTHLYRTSFRNSFEGYTRPYLYSDVFWALNATEVISVASEYPVWIGEIGCSLWESELDEEYEWYDNTLTVLDQYNIGYCAWAWAPWRSPGTQWGLVDVTQTNYTPNQAGQLFQQHLSNQ
ncbi:MAG: glycoside hydrolase family 5 protein [Candidatus Bathyarchaeota archaeon]|nr:glycoside hydrolase family 5 protein [Candidatus Bathyarchaeum sp.]